VRLQATSVDAGEALIAFGDIPPLQGQDKAKVVLNLSPSGDLAEAATNLFGYLKLADASGAASIAVTAIPQHGLGEAINDRLARAAAPRS
jgi:L-threonylcarbamoyladenylate synthase